MITPCYRRACILLSCACTVKWCMDNPYLLLCTLAYAASASASGGATCSVTIRHDQHFATQHEEMVTGEQNHTGGSLFAEISCSSLLKVSSCAKVLRCTGQ